MSESLEQEIRHLRSLFWSDRDPEGRGFVPLADAYRRAGELSQARELVEEGLNRLPAFSSGHVVAARVHEAGGADDLAETSWRRVLELDGDNAQALGALGTILVDRGEVEEGRKLLTRAGELSPRGEEPGARPEQTPAVEETAADEEPPVTAAGAEFLGAGVAEEEDLEDLLSELPGRRAFSGAEGEGVEEADPAPVTAGDDDGPPRTRTLAELYARQGLVERAVEVYEHLLARNPGDEEIRARLDELRSPDDVEAPTVPEPDDHQDDEEVESVARLMSEGGDTAPVDSPFAWHEEEEGEPAAEGRPVSEYFESLLAWRPGTTTTEPVAEREPVAEPEAIVEPEAVAEPEAVDIATLAPEAPPAEPGAGVEPGVVDIGTLAPDEEVVDIASLAPDASPDEGNGDEGNSDDFTRWLNQLK